MRRFFGAGAASFILALLLLTGCVSDSGVDNNLKRVPKIVLLMEKSTENLSDSELVIEKLNEYIKPIIGVEIDILFAGTSTYGKTLQAMLAAEEQVDIVFSVAFGSLVSLVDEGKVIPLDALINQYGNGITEQIVPDELVVGRVGGRLYGVTTNRNKGFVFGFQYRKDIAEKYDIDMSAVKRLEDLTSVFQTLKDANPDMRPYIPSRYARTWDHLSLDYLDFGVLMDCGQNLDVVNLYETQTYEDYVRLIYEWNRAGYVLDTTLNYSSDRHYYFRSDNAFCRLDTDSPEMIERESRVVGKPIGYVALSPVFTCTIDMTYAMWSITSSCANPDKAMEFLNLMYSDPAVANLLLNGVEGAHYVFADKEQALIDFPPGLDSTTSGYFQHSGWKYGNMFITYVWAGNRPSVWGEIRDYNKTSLKSKALGFVFDPSPVSNEYANCARVWLRYNDGLNAGVLDPDVYLPKLREEMKAAGIDRIIAEKERQLNEWLDAM
ncbi:MAG: ABC transporter substrate-binding protein [Oscillospiraceae bacterium]|nr:ABC transporter substrate-binding protein [Oscillospiraceae bacterium]